MKYLLIVFLFLSISFFIKKYFSYLKINKFIKLYINSLTDLKNIKNQSKNPEVIFNNISFSALKLLLRILILSLPFIIFYKILEMFFDINYLFIILIACTIYWPLINYKSQS